jgi:serine palmitoyltransferase
MLYEWIVFVVNDFFQHPYLYGLQIMMIIWVFYLYFKKSYKDGDREELTPLEFEELIQTWVPEPLVPSDSGEVDERLSKCRIIDGKNDTHVIVDDKECLNFATFGFLNLHVNEQVIQASIDCTNIYGIGSCGPRGFYGSLKPHTDLEARIATFMGAEESLIFSDAAQSVASVIPAFSSTGDILVVDRGICLSVQNGVTLSRSDVLWFDHNDVGDIRRVLLSLEETFAKEKKRVWLIIEGLYNNYGDIAPLKEIMALKEEFPFRIMIDDSLGIGVLGSSGLGVIDHLGIDQREIEIIIGSLGTSFGGVGGFACGVHMIVDHMRLNCTGYVFSASLPPYISAACIKSIDLIGTENLRDLLRRNCEYFHETIAMKNWPMVNRSDPLSPIIHLELINQTSHKQDQRIISQLVDKLFDEFNIILSHSAYLAQEKHIPSPSLRILLNALHTQDDLDTLISSLDTVFSSL